MRDIQLSDVIALIFMFSAIAGAAGVAIGYANGRLHEIDEAKLNAADEKEGQQ